MSPPTRRKRRAKPRKRRAPKLLPVLPVPATRADCPSSRPCRVHLCRHNLATETERPGRPHNGRHSLPIVRDKAESCALDVVGAAPDGLGPEAIATLLDVTMRRIQQISNRAVLKTKVALVLDDHADVLRAALPAGSFVEAVIHRGGDNPYVVTATYVIGVERLGAGLGHQPKARKPVPREGNDEMPVGLTSDEAKRATAAARGSYDPLRDRKLSSPETPVIHRS